VNRSDPSTKEVFSKPAFINEAQFFLKKHSQRRPILALHTEAIP
jgi:hypothetical protein